MKKSKCLGSVSRIIEKMEKFDEDPIKRKRKLPPDKNGTSDEPTLKKPKLSQKIQKQIEEDEIKRHLKLFSMAQLVLLARHFFEKTPLSARALTNRTRVTNSLVGLARRNRKVI